MKMPKLVVGYLLDDEMFAKSFTIPESLAWVKWLANEELAQFFGELLELMLLISEDKEDSETLQTFLDFWREIALSWREIALDGEDSEIFEEDSETSPTVVTDWNVDALEATLKGQEPVSLLSSLAGFIGKAMISSERDVLGDILEGEQELDSPWIDIIEDQHERDPLFPNIYREPEIADVTEQERDDYLTLSIAALRLPTRAHNCLERANIYTLCTLVEKTEEELLLISNFGMGSLQKVKAGLAPMGLYLGMDLDDEDDEETSF